MITDQQGQLLIRIARATISEALDQNFETIMLSPEDNVWMNEYAACFVTLTQNKQLRGCIGSLQPYRRLIDDVKSNAKAAAFGDPRFQPITADELPSIDIEVSLLSLPVPLDYQNEQDALQKLQPGIDGVILEFGSYRSTFLPQVWEQLPNRNNFMAHLKEKAGLSDDFWSNEIKLQRYSVKKWKEHKVQGENA